MMQPFVIAGMGRSGSTFLYMVLRDHPMIALTNEAKIVEVLARENQLCSLPSQKIVDGVRGVVNSEYIPLLSKIHEGHARRLLEDFYQQSFTDRKFTHWGDKLPNAASILFLKRILPETKVIVLARDPRDVVCSFRAFARKMETTPEDKAFYAKDDHASNWLREYELLTTLPDYHLLLYQDLVTQPERAVTSALEYLGLEMRPLCMVAIEDNAIFSFHGTSKTPEQSLGRWQDELSADEAAAIAKSCGPMMERLGLE